MITTTNSSSGSSYIVTFDCSPKPLTYYGVTHSVNRTNRHGIQEGIKLVEAWYRLNGGAWVSKGATNKFSVSTSVNGTKIEAKARYELRTMGFHWQNHSYPFFYFAHNADGGASWPPQTYLHSHYARVGTDWTKKSVSWSGWCQKNASVSSTTWKNNKEYRNGQSYTYGWNSDKNTGSSGTTQESRKSIMMVFTKDYVSSSSTSSGIATEPDAPSLEVPYMIGDEGKVVVTYKDSKGIKGKVWLRAECDGKNADIATWDTSPSYGHNWIKTYYPNFNSMFGESYRGNDVIYYARARNDYGYESSLVSKGTQRYNDRPSTPSSANASATTSVMTCGWATSTDPDGDAVSYRVDLYHLQNGQWVQQPGPGKDNGYWTSSTSMSFPINNVPEGTRMKIRVWAYDGRIYSHSYAESNISGKGYTPKVPSFVFPKSGVYSNRPRIVLHVKGDPDEGSNIQTLVKWQGTWYDNRNNSSCFSVPYYSSASMSDHYQVFCPPSSDPAVSSNPIEFKVYNGYGTTSPSSKTIIKLAKPIDIAQVDGYITTEHVMPVTNCLRLQASAYDLNAGEIYTPSMSTPIKAVDVNQMWDSLKKLNKDINEYGYELTPTTDEASLDSPIKASHVNKLFSSITEI